MPHLLNKSEENIKAANKLISSGYFASSVHSSYYSCLQLMSHILEKSFGMGFEKINELASNEGTGSHVIITNKIKDGLMGSKNKNFMELQSFHANIGILKRKRVDADYRNVVIEKKNSDDCFKMANDARAILKKYFSIK